MDSESVKLLLDKVDRVALKLKELSFTSNGADNEVWIYKINILFNYICNLHLIYKIILMWYKSTFIKLKKEFYKVIVENMPQFIVVGPQSSGKSSALKRISGIKLPEAANRCTRVV